VVPGVRALLDLAESRDADCASVDVLAATHLAEIDRKVADPEAPFPCGAVYVCSSKLDGFRH
jgi:hypothetical protein